MTSQEQSGLNVVKASVFRRWLVTAPYRGEQTTRLTGGQDFSVRHAKEMTLVEQDLCRAARKEAGAIKIIVQRRLTVDAFAEGSLINEVA